MWLALTLAILAQACSPRARCPLLWIPCCSVVGVVYTLQTGPSGPCVFLLCPSHCRCFLGAGDPFSVSLPTSACAYVCACRHHCLPFSCCAKSRGPPWHLAVSVFGSLSQTCGQAGSVLRRVRDPQGGPRESSSVKESRFGNLLRGPSEAILRGEESARGPVRVVLDSHPPGCKNQIIDLSQGSRDYRPPGQATGTPDRGQSPLRMPTPSYKVRGEGRCAQHHISIAEKIDEPHEG